MPILPETRAGRLIQSQRADRHYQELAVYCDDLYKKAQVCN